MAAHPIYSGIELGEDDIALDLSVVSHGAECCGHGGHPIFLLPRGKPKFPHRLI
jgi:hypothetical protein